MNTDLFFSQGSETMRKDNPSRDYNEIISGVPQSFILGPILLNLSINALFFSSRWPLCFIC